MARANLAHGYRLSWGRPWVSRGVCDWILFLARMLGASKGECLRTTWCSFYSIFSVFWGGCGYWSKAKDPNPELLARLFRLRFCIITWSMVFNEPNTKFTLKTIKALRFFPWEPFTFTKYSFLSLKLTLFAWNNQDQSLLNWYHNIYWSALSMVHVRCP